MESFRAKFNEAIKINLPEDNKNEIKVFCCLEVGNKFNAKNATSFREYSYYLPTFLLAKNTDIYLGKKGTELEVEENVAPKEEDVTNVKVVNGVTITRRFVNQDDVPDKDDSYLLRNITHLTENPTIINDLYAYRLA
jgi:tRNA pseudouridine(38-40) synthase